MKKILSNQRGIALMMIITSILFLTVIYGDFTFDSKISRLKATNIMDRTQAKLLAESGLQMAMTRLRLYKEAYNTIQGNQNLKNVVPANLLNQLWEVPYMYPVPLGEGANRAFRDSVDKFMKESVMDGEMRVTVQNISNRLNLNMLRIDMQKLALQQSGDADGDGIKDEDEDEQARESQNTFSVDQALYFTMRRLVEEKREKDDAFADRYGNVNYQVLFANLKFYMSDFGTNQYDPMFGEAEQNFQRQPETPKYGPMTSASEIYAVPGWDDALIELIQNEFSVYPTTQIDLNKITENFLKILIPDINNDEVAKFFQLKNAENDPKFFNTVDDFKKFVVAENFTTDAAIDERIKMFESKGISFGSNPNLFKIIAEGISNRSTYTLVATVVLPKQEQQKPQPKPGEEQPPAERNRNSTQNQSTQLLEPRIIEIQVN